MDELDTIIIGFENQQELDDMDWGIAKHAIRDYEFSEDPETVAKVTYLKKLWTKKGGSGFEDEDFSGCTITSNLGLKITTPSDFQKYFRFMAMYKQQKDFGKLFMASLTAANEQKTETSSKVRTKKANIDSEEEEEEKPNKKNSKAKKKAKVDSEEEEEEEEKPNKKNSKARKKAKVDSEEEEKPNKKNSKARKKAKVDSEEE